MSYQTVPRHSPADVIKSEEWNLIADDLDYLYEQITANQETLKRRVFITACSAINAGESKELALGCTDIEGRTSMPIDGKIGSIYVRAESNGLDTDIEIKVCLNGGETLLKVTLKSGETRASATLAEGEELGYEAGDDLSILVDASPATSGSIAKLVIAIY